MISVPIGLKEVILTTNCASCTHTNISLENSPTSVNLVWGSDNCEERFEVSSEKPKAVEQARNYLYVLGTNVLTEPFNNSEIQSINKDLGRGMDSVSEADRTINLNDSLLHAYYAEWFAKRAQYKMRLFELKYCVDKLDSLLRPRENDPCFVPEYNAYTDYVSANVTYFSLKNGRLLEDYPFEVKELEKMKQETSYVHNQIEQVSESLEKCETSFRIINGTFEYQKPYCESRSVTFGTTYLIWLIVSFYLGLLVEMGRKVWKK